MQCWECDLPPRASCRFCGRFVCKNHSTKMPYIVTMFVGENNIPKALAVADVIWCGICQPLPEPMPMPELY
jgi:hypothetical protein